MKNPEDVSYVHEIVKKEGIDSKVLLGLQKSIQMRSSKDRENLIFDVTMKDVSMLEEISEMSTRLGYDLKNIHIVWVLTDLSTALERNSKRDRTIEEKLAISIHQKVAKAGTDIIKSMHKYKHLFDGDFWIIFNNLNDTTMTIKDGSVGRKKPRFVSKSNYIKVKSSGKVPNEEDVNRAIKSLVRYIPDQ